jgi:hypothetical protein
MARLNAKRRRALALKLARHELAKDLNPTTQASIGQVRSSHKAKVANQLIPSVARAYSPKPLNLDSSGVRGRVVSGRVMPPKKPARWSDR